MVKHLLFFSAVIFSAQSASKPELTKLTPPTEHGECPSWDHRNLLVNYVDIPNGKIFRYNYTSQILNTITLDGEIAPVIQSKASPDLLIIGLNRSIVAVQWDDVNNTLNTKTISNLPDNHPDSFFNEGKADKEGRLWFGTQGKNKTGALYKITRESLDKPEAMIEEVSTSNGMAWNKDNNKFYYVDSPTRKVVVYDYDNANGTLSNKKVAFDFDTVLQDIEKHVIPDGMTIDKDDNLWIALWGGGAVIKVNPQSGKMLEKHAIPSTYVTSTIWGGPNYDVLFITTSRLLLNDEQKEKEPEAGCLFALTNTGASGWPVFQADVIDNI